MVWICRVATHCASRPLRKPHAWLTSAMADKSPPPDLTPQELAFWNRLVLRDEEWIRAHPHIYTRPYKRRLRDLYLRRLEQEQDEAREVRREETAWENARLGRGHDMVAD